MIGRLVEVRRKLWEVEFPDMRPAETIEAERCDVTEAGVLRLYNGDRDNPRIVAAFSGGRWASVIAGGLVENARNAA